MGADESIPTSKKIANSDFMIPKENYLSLEITRLE
jgi:hypothetical protein